MVLHLEAKSLENVKDGFHLEDISLDIGEGEIVLIGGKNASGKTTLLETLSFVSPPNRGMLKYFDEIVFEDGKRNKTLRSARELIGAQFQEEKLYDNLTVKETFELFSKNYRNDNFQEVVSNCPPIKGLLKKKVGALSEGKSQLVQFLLSIIHDPELVMLDEPVSNLDEKTQSWVFEKIKELKSDGTSFLIALNEIWKIADISDKLIILQDGKIFKTVNDFFKFKKGCFFRVDSNVDYGSIKDEEWILKITREEQYIQGFSSLEKESLVERMDVPLVEIREVKLNDFYPDGEEI